MINLAIFASGNGSNAQAIINHFACNSTICVKLIITNNAMAGVIEKAQMADIQVEVIHKTLISDASYILAIFKKHQIDWVILAGYLKPIPQQVISQFPNKILNIHPALLPKFGGNGMYGIHIHQAVIAASEATSGVTIHFVNEHYDEGKIICQYKIPIEKEWDAAALQNVILKLEHIIYPVVIETVINSFPQ